MLLPLAFPRTTESTIFTRRVGLAISMRACVQMPLVAMVVRLSPISILVVAFILAFVSVLILLIDLIMALGWLRRERVSDHSNWRLRW
jgi:uncharacterized membrane protein